MTRFVRRSHGVAVVLALSCLALPAAGQTLAEQAAQVRREQERDRLLKILPPLEGEAWRQWVERTGALPPDFATMPREALLPDALAMQDGTPVTTPQQWQARRQEILRLFEDYAWGHWPAEVPPVRAEAGPVEPAGEGRVGQEVTLHVGPNEEATLTFRVERPDKPGRYPVYLLPGRRWYRNWTAPAAEREYVMVWYDANDASDSSESLETLYPELDWTTLYRRAYAGQRVLDYVAEQPYVHPEQIGISGLSRDATQILMLAAQDPRITAVVDGSAGALMVPYRLYNETHMVQGVEGYTRREEADWHLPSLRFYSGRESYLPFDFHFLSALIAPRPMLHQAAEQDWVEGPWRMEKILEQDRRVYGLLGAEDRVAMIYRPGGHVPTGEQMNRNFDWFDAAFGYQRGNRDFTFEPLYPYSFERWKAASGEAIDPAFELPERGFPRLTDAGAWPGQRAAIVERIGWLLGEAPDERPAPPAQVGEGAGETQAQAEQLARTVVPEGTEKLGITFGEGIRGALFRPADWQQKGRLPAIVWCAPLNWETGWAGVNVDWPNAYVSLAQAGMVLLVHDPIGTGNRFREYAGFYDEHPHWSLMGRMVRDTHAAVAALRELDYVDPERIYLVGYAHGGAVALLSAATDERVAGVACVAGFTPLRSELAGKGTRLIERFSDLYGTLPRLGFFRGFETHIPVDFDEVLAAIAPRPVLVVAPTLDQYATHEDVLEAVERARGAYALLEAPRNLAVFAPEEYNHFPPSMAAQVVQWLRRTADAD